MSPVTCYSVIESRLAVDGRVTTVEVSGDRIEGQFALEQDAADLVLVSAGLPWDDWLEVLLVDRAAHTLLDAVHAGAPFTCTMVELKSVGPAHVDLTFFSNGQIYRIAIAPEPRYGGIQPVGWRYARLALRHRLSVRQVVS